MDMARAWAAIGAVAMAVAVPAGAQPARSVKEGQGLYVSVGCYQCHGRAAQGSLRVGPKLAPTPIPYGVFAEAVRHPRDEMPPYSERVLSEDQLASIYAYLQTIRPSRSADQIPELK